MKHQYHPEARIELVNAADFLEQRTRGLGGDLVEEIFSAGATICEVPERWPEIAPSIRKYRTRRFRYQIVYRILEGQVVEIIAIAHSARRPGYWRERIAR